MSGTYQLDGELFPINPIQKNWAPTTSRRSGGSGIRRSPGFWDFEMKFPITDFGTGTVLAFFYEALDAGGLHSAVLPHPNTGYPTIFSGVSIKDIDYQLFDIPDYAERGTVVLTGISLNNSYSIPNQLLWWFYDALEYHIELSVTADAIAETNTATYTITNDDNDTLFSAITNIPVPSGLNFSSAVGQGTYASGVWTVGEIVGGDSVSIIITYDVTSGTGWDHTATMDCVIKNLTPANNTVTDTAEYWFVAGGVSSGDVFGAYQAKGNTSLANSYVNMNNPGTNDLVAGEPPAWDATNGWHFLATDVDYLISGKPPSPGITIITGFNKRNGYGFFGDPFGAADATNTCAVHIYGSASDFVLRYDNTPHLASTLIPNTEPVSVVLGTSTSSDGLTSKIYKDGVKGDEDTGTTSATISQNIWVGAKNDNGTPSYISGIYMQSFVIYNSELTEAQVAAVSAAMAAL